MKESEKGGLVQVHSEIQGSGAFFWQVGEENGHQLLGHCFSSL